MPLHDDAAIAVELDLESPLLARRQLRATGLHCIDSMNASSVRSRFEMDQSSVMPPQPGAPMPEAPFDPGRFSVDQITLSELEERSGLDFGSLKDFDVLAAQPVPSRC